MSRVVPLGLWLGAAVACASPARDPGQPDPPAPAAVEVELGAGAEPVVAAEQAPAQPVAPQPVAPEPVAPEPVPLGGAQAAAVVPEPLPVDVPLPGEPAAAEDAGVDPAPGTTLPADSPTRFRFVPFGPVAGTSAEEFAHWFGLLADKYLADVDASRVAEIDAALADVHIVDLTPAYINLTNGLDMAEPLDVITARAVTNDWYLAQERYKKVALNGDPEDLSERAVNGRLVVLDAWVRFWKKETENDRVERYRDRLDTLMAKLERLRAERRAGAKLSGDG